MHKTKISKFISNEEKSEYSISLCFYFLQEWFCLFRSQLDFICILRPSIFRNLIFLLVRPLKILSKRIDFIDLLPRATIAFLHLLYENFLFLLFILTKWQNNVFLCFLLLATDIAQLTVNSNMIKMSFVIILKLWILPSISLNLGVIGKKGSWGESGRSWDGAGAEGELRNSKLKLIWVVVLMVVWEDYRDKATLPCHDVNCSCALPDQWSRCPC